MVRRKVDRACVVETCPEHFPVMTGKLSQHTGDGEKAPETVVTTMSVMMSMDCMCIACFSGAVYGSQECV